MEGRVLLTVAQVIQMLQIARGRAYQLVAQGVIPSVRIGRSVRVPYGALMEWIARESHGQVSGAYKEN